MSVKNERFYQSFELWKILIVFVLTLLVTAFIRFYWKLRQMHQVIADLPGPVGYPFIGVALNIWTDSPTVLFRTFYNYFQDNPDLFKVLVVHKVLIGVSRPEHIEILLNNPHCLEKDSVYYFLKILVGDGLFSAPVHIWRKNRKLIDPTFSNKILNSFVKVFSSNANVFVKVLGHNSGKKNLDILNLTSAYTLDSLCETAMNIKMQVQTTQIEEHFGILMDKSMYMIIRRIPNIFYHFETIYKRTNLYKDLKETITKMKQFTKKVIEEKARASDRELRAIRLGQITEDDHRTKSFLDHMLHLQKDGVKFTHAELEDEVNTFMAAGSETSALALGFCLLVMGMLPDEQRKLYEEAIEVLGEHSDVTYHDLPHLKYTERFIKETLRLFPIGPFFLRAPTHDIDLDGHILPRGCTIILCPLFVQRNPKYWNEPLKFDTDRFLPEEVAKRHPYSYFPFSKGPRGCIGAKYTMMELKTVLSTVVRKFTFYSEYKSIEEVDLSFNVLLRPTGGFKVSFEQKK